MEASVVISFEADEVDGNFLQRIRAETVRAVEDHIATVAGLGERRRRSSGRYRAVASQLNVPLPGAAYVIVYLVDTETAQVLDPSVVLAALSVVPSNDAVQSFGYRILSVTLWLEWQTPTAEPPVTVAPTEDVATTTAKAGVLGSVLFDTSSTAFIIAIVVAALCLLLLIILLVCCCCRRRYRDEYAVADAEYGRGKRHPDSGVRLVRMLPDATAASPVREEKTKGLEVKSQLPPSVYGQRPVHEDQARERAWEPVNDGATPRNGGATDGHDEFEAALTALSHQAGEERVQPRGAWGAAHAGGAGPAEADGGRSRHSAAVDTASLSSNEVNFPPDYASTDPQQRRDGGRRKASRSGALTPISHNRVGPGGSSGPAAITVQPRMHAWGQQRTAPAVPTPDYAASRGNTGTPGWEEGAETPVRGERASMDVTVFTSPEAAIQAQPRDTPWSRNGVLERGRAAQVRRRQEVEGETATPLHSVGPEVTEVRPRLQDAWSTPSDPVSPPGYTSPTRRGRFAYDVAEAPDGNNMPPNIRREQPLSPSDPAEARLEAALGDAVDTLDLFPAQHPVDDATVLSPTTRYNAPPGTPQAAVTPPQNQRLHNQLATVRRREKYLEFLRQARAEDHKLRSPQLQGSLDLGSPIRPRAEEQAHREFYRLA